MSENTGTEKNRITGATLYLVATPIGNLSDISERAVKVLSGVDFIAAEDTRNTGKLLASLGIKKELVSYFEHNKKERGGYILARLQAGEACALVTDAGMPAISDPGEDLVRLCAGGGVAVTAVPGACAAVTALALSALPSRRFVFEGFLPAERKERDAVFSSLLREERTVIIYEAPHRLRETLSALASALGGKRRISLCRELTKLHEEIIRTDLDGAVSRFSDCEIRGEFVLVLEGASPAAEDFSSLSPAEHVSLYEGRGMSRMDAIKAAAADRGVPKSTLYKELLPKD